MTLDDAIDVFDRAVEAGYFADLYTPSRGFLFDTLPEVRRRLDDLFGRRLRRALRDALLYNRFMIAPRENQGWDEAVAVYRARQNRAEALARKNRARRKKRPPQ